MATRHARAQGAQAPRGLRLDWRCETPISRASFSALAAAALCGVSAAALGLTGCSGENGSAMQADPRPGSALPPVSDPSREPEAEPEPTAEELLARRVAEKLDAMTLEQKVAQLFIVRPEALTGVGLVTAAGETTRNALEQMPVGGLVYFADNLRSEEQTRAMLANTQAYARELSGLPVFLCVDEEGGTVSRVGGNPGFAVENVGNMCDVGATGDASEAYRVAQRIGTYLVDLGFNVDFAPDADIANNPESATMALRAFGSAADVVAPMVAAQVRGFTDAGVLCAAKHFPGIGGADGDSHNTAIYSYKTADEMASEELKPFQAAIGEGVPLVMVGHLSCPAVTGDDDPASISAEVVTGLLRDRLGDQGIVVTDSMAMGAATSTLSADRLAVEAVKAGVDIVLMPEDFHAAYRGVLDAVASGEVDGERIDESVGRILSVKLGRLEG